MDRFMIGMFDTFDYKKFRRDFRENFFGIEACLLKSEREVENLIKEARENDFKIGVHFPLRAGISELRDPLFLSGNEDIRKSALKLIEKEIEYMKKVNPHYVLFHFPKPVILDENVDWKYWRFADPREFVSESEYAYSDFKNNCEMLFKWLDEKGREYSFIPVLEFDALNKYVYSRNMLEELLEKYTSVKLCLDTARLHLQASIDKSFDALSLIIRFAKYAEVIHVSNVRTADNLEKNHYPALPGLRREDGWAPIEEYLSIISQENSGCKILFEHRSELISDEELEECYLWINSILSKK